ncbi:MAG: T9SS type A sorting domain-containing protein [Flavobacteriaceae bacterium]
MRHLLVLCILLSSPITLLSQNIEKFSIDAGGENISINDFKMIYTIGEVSVQEINLESLIVSEGFINPNILNTLSIETPTFFTIKIYPNPTSNYFTIQSKLKINKIEIFDQLGKVINEINSEMDFIDVSHYSKGVYLLKIDTEKGSFSKKLIIN